MNWKHVLLPTPTKKKKQVQMHCLFKGKSMPFNDNKNRSNKKLLTTFKIFFCYPVFNNKQVNVRYCLEAIDKQLSLLLFHSNYKRKKCLKLWEFMILVTVLLVNITNYIGIWQ